MKERFRCIFVDWAYAYDLCEDVSKKIKEVMFIPDFVVGVTRGGWFLARVLCDFLMLKELFSLKTEHWGITATITGKAEIKHAFSKDVEERMRGKKVLIADDVTDTGDSLKLAEEYLRSLGAEETKTATLHHKTSSPFIPDFYGEELKEWKWVIYPWSFHEDIMELVERVFSKEKKLHLENIKFYMKDYFDLYLPYHRLKDVLDNMEFYGRVKRKKESGKEVWFKLFREEV